MNDLYLPPTRLGLAGVLGIIILVYKYYNGLSRFHMKNIYAGLLLGIPNYFSIYLLMSSYQTTGWKDGTVLSVTNVSVVILSALIGFIFFKEKTSVRRILGLVSAILAILILALNN